MASFAYIVYITLRDHGYLEELKEKMKNAKEKMSEGGEEEEEDEDEEEWQHVDAEEVLRQRFAGGEIDEAEYTSRLSVLRKE